MRMHDNKYHMQQKQSEYRISRHSKYHMQQKQSECKASRHTTAQLISIQPLQTQQKPCVTKAQYNADKHSLF